MSSLRARLANRHAEKLIPPAELQHIQQLWDDSNRAEKVEIFNELDSYNTDQVKRLFQLIARQRKFLIFRRKKSSKFRKWSQKSYFYPRGIGQRTS